MTTTETYSWIFYATALASQQSPANWGGVSMIADGINHAVPTHNEMQEAITFCTRRGLIRSIGKKLELTSAGSELLDSCSLHPRTVSAVWQRLEKRFRNL